VGNLDFDWVTNREWNGRGPCRFLRRSLISWKSKMKNCTSLSIIEAKYVAMTSFYAYSLWMKQTLEHHRILCTNASFVWQWKSDQDWPNPVQHERTKHTDIRHNFVCDHVAIGDIFLIMWTLRSLFRYSHRAIGWSKFHRLRRELGLLDSKNLIWLFGHILLLPVIFLRCVPHVGRAFYHLLS
jgi:hypothetical protein